MKRFVSNNALILWLSKAQAANVAYYKNRKSLWSAFAPLVQLKGAPAEHDIEISSEDYNSIWGFLNTRNEKMTDDSRLNFQNVISQLLEMCVVVDEEEEDSSNQTTPPRTPSQLPQGALLGQRAQATP